jgi:chaperonin GroES
VTPDANPTDATTVGTESGAPVERPRHRVPVRMLHDRLLVLPEVDSAERHTTAGLVIPATASGPKKLAWAKVVAVGENVHRVHVGDRVLFDSDERAEIDLDAENYVLLRERDVHAVFERPADAAHPGLYL